LWFPNNTEKKNQSLEGDGPWQYVLDARRMVPIHHVMRYHFVAAVFLL
jgi:hypothetical protein